MRIYQIDLRVNNVVSRNLICADLLQNTEEQKKKEIAEILRKKKKSFDFVLARSH